jgi:hypothetical protein
MTVYEAGKNGFTFNIKKLGGFTGVFLNFAG